MREIIKSPLSVKTSFGALMDKLVSKHQPVCQKEGKYQQCQKQIPVTLLDWGHCIL